MEGEEGGTGQGAKDRNVKRKKEEVMKTHTHMQWSLLIDERSFAVVVFGCRLALMKFNAQFYPAIASHSCALRK